MADRRQFFKDAAHGTAGVLFARCGLAAPVQAVSPDASKRRRQVTIGGRRVKTIDAHAHTIVPEVLELIQDQALVRTVRATATAQLSISDERLRQMDEQGVDVELLSINPFWYGVDRELARKLVDVQNEKLAALCAAHPDRFAALAAVALQHPDLAAEQLEAAVKKHGLKGAAIGGSINGEELSAAKFEPFWAKAEELGALIFIHPQGMPEIRVRLQGNGFLGNVIGNPLETTIALSHLIFEGTLDRFPRLKILAAHGGGFFPSYSGRFDRGCLTFPASCNKTNKKPPSEYLKQLHFDSLVFTGEALRHLVAECGASQVVLGTDFPYPWVPAAVDHVLGTPGLSDGDRVAILGGNLAKLLAS